MRTLKRSGVTLQDIENKQKQKTWPSCARGDVTADLAGHRIRAHA
jgi:hypothetical protein